MGSSPAVLALRAVKACQHRRAAVRRSPPLEETIHRIRQELAAAHSVRKVRRMVGVAPGEGPREHDGALIRCVRCGKLL
jgi:hypothetical protein